MSGILTSRRSSAKGVAAVDGSEALGALCDRHGAALFTLALAMTDDPVSAEEVVVDVLVQADPRATSSRHELARAVYLRSRALSLSGQDSRTSWTVGGQQRAAVCLAHHGGHTLDDLALLLGTSRHAAADLLRSGLRAFSGAAPGAVGSTPGT